MSDQPRIRVLLAEDEAALGAILKDYLEGRGHLVTHVSDGRAAIEALATRAFDVALLDIVMPEADGLTVLKALRESPEPPEAIIITGNGTIDTAITALKLGAYDYMAKPYRMLEIEMQVRRAWEKRELLRQNTLLTDRLERAERVTELVTEDPAMRDVLALAERVAGTTAPVLVTGERGTGKRSIARAIHRLSLRAARSFVEVACAELAPEDAETLLFGADRGAGSGPVAARPGLLEQAHGGTVMLDDVDRLDARLQGRLLRLLEDGIITRVGGVQKIDLDVRLIVSATHGLSTAVEQRLFRSDLAYRLGGYAIAVPPLRERPRDVPALARHFLEVYGGSRRRFSESALEALRQYSWPGNVLELRAVIERAALLAVGPVVEAHELGVVPVVREPRASDDATLSLELIERRHIEEVLMRHQWHQGRASATLGISAKTLYRKIREYGLERPSGGR